MPIVAPSFSQIKAQVTAIRQKLPKAKVIGIHADGQWTGEQIYRDGTTTYIIRQCNSPLAIRMGLQATVDEESSQANDAIQVIITALDETQLEEDILLRFAKRRLFPIDSWQIAKSLFYAQDVDPRLVQHHWIADYLIDWMTDETYPRVSGGFLDAETVWPILLRRGFGFTARQPDLINILEWSIDAKHIQQFQSAPEHFRKASVDWLVHLAGPTVKVIMHCVEHNQQPNALPIGLVAQVLYHPDVAGQLDKAVGRMEERFLAGESPNLNLLEKWVAAAIETIQRSQIDPGPAYQLLKRADQILNEIGAESFAYLSTVTELGFNQRLSQFGHQLLQCLSRSTKASIRTLAASYQAIKQHHQAQQSENSRRMERAEMAMRLIQWLTHIQKNPPSQPHSLKDAIAYQISDGSFLDWARLSLRAGDPVNELSTAYSKLFEKVTEFREKQAYQFATCLQNWLAVGSTKSDVTTVETILETVVAPLIAQTPVLLIVMDGMSTAVCRELMTNIQKSGWITVTRSGQTSAIEASLACVPSITSTSRTSLLCGQLKVGKAHHEEKEFTTHPILLKHCRQDAPPRLFHKASLQNSNDAGLSSDIRDAISESTNQLVGVIVNAVDDHLSKGEQIDVQWSCSSIKSLSALLYEAKIASRLVVLLSDHGHILDCHTERSSADGGEQRWRTDDQQVQAGELQISGDRVLIPDNHRLIAPWSEKLRYKTQRNGYHGGISPQEMVIPIITFATTTETIPKGWVQSTDDSPIWWQNLTQKQVGTPNQSTNELNTFSDFGPLFN